MCCHGCLSAAFRLLLVTVPFLLFCSGNDVCGDEDLVLPLGVTDQVVVRSGPTHRLRTYSGIIEDISGQSVVLRRSGGTVVILRLREVTALRFPRSRAFDDGLSHVSQGRWADALSSLRSAEETEPRRWVVREIRAARAQAERANRDFEGALRTVESILEDDPETRHVTELPLVWDERLPADDRMVLNVADLESPSQARKLTAASSLLHDPNHQAAAATVLRTLKTARGTLKDLAEAQLWRLQLVPSTESVRNTLKEAEIRQWMQHVRFLDRRTRSGPEFLIGRGLRMIYDDDLAAISLLWMPLMEPLDPWTTQSSLKEALEALESSGRHQEADVLRREFQDQLR